MDNEFDDFNNAVDNIKVERPKTKFEITQLKLEHHYWNFGDIDVGMPISTSIELICAYNFDKEKLDWKKIISHTYLSFDDYQENITDSYTEELNNSEQLINEIQKNDLRNLGNNYFTDENPERLTHWELNYNNYFKIVGTYDQNIEEFVRISDLLDFKKVIEKETKKVQDKLEQSKN